MKKLIFILFLFISIVGFSQEQNITIGKGKLEGILYNTKSGATDTIIALHPDSLGQFKLMNVSNPVNELDAVNLRYFEANATSWDSIVNNDLGYAVIWQGGSKIDSFQCVTVDQMMDTIATLPGGHNPVTIGTAGTTAGITLNVQELNMQSATAARNGYLRAVDFLDFFNKLTTVSHNNTLTGSGTAADPLKADTAIMAAKVWVLSQNYITELQLDWDSLENKPTIPVISDIAYDATTWDANADGASKNAIRDKIESLAGGHDAVTLSDSALAGGLSLAGQELDFQSSNPSQSGYLRAVDFERFNQDTSATNELQNLTYSTYSDKGIMLISNGTGDTIPAASATIAGLMIPADKDTFTVHNTRLIALERNSGGGNMFIEGRVTGRTIDITYPYYVPSDGYMIHIIPDADIALSGDSISISINGLNARQIHEYYQHDQDYALELVYAGGRWFVLMGKGEGTFAKGTNTGDEGLSETNLKVSGTSTAVTIHSSTGNDIIANAGTNVSFAIPDSTQFTINAASTGSGMTYPGAGIPLSTGSDWGTSITNNSANWNAAYGWGNHAGLYELLGEAATLIATHNSTYNHANFATAYGWGNHASAGYDPSSTNELQTLTLDSTATKYIIGATDGNTVSFLKSGSGSSLWTQGTGTIYPLTITDEVRIGGTTDRGNYKLQVTGESYMFGGLTMGSLGTITIPDLEGEPTGPSSGYGKVYVNADKLYFKSDADVVYDLTSGSGSYTLPLSANGTRGGLQIGYSSTANNFALQLSSEKAFTTLPDATTAVKGIASFSTTNFTTTSGAVSIKTGGVTSANIADKGATTQILYNNAGTISGTANMTTNGTNVTIAGHVVSDESRVQALNTNSSTVTFNALSGFNAIVTVTTNTSFTFTMSNLTAGKTGNITIVNTTAGGAITLSGYTNKIAPSIYTAANIVTTSGSSKIDVYSWYYDGSRVLWNGAKDYR